MQNQDWQYQRTVRRVRALSWFYRHSLVSLLLSVLLTANYGINSLLAGQWIYFWLPWPLAVIASLLVCHYLAVFVLNEDLRRRLVGSQLQKEGFYSLAEPGQSYSPEYHRAYQIANAQAGVKIGFYWHLVVWAILNFLCLLTYFVTSLELHFWYYPWPIWSFVIMTLTLAAHRVWMSIFDGTFARQLLEKELRQS